MVLLRAAVLVDCILMFLVSILLCALVAAVTVKEVKSLNELYRKLGSTLVDDGFINRVSHQFHLLVSLSVERIRFIMFLEINYLFSQNLDEVNEVWVSG